MTQKRSNSSIFVKTALVTSLLSTFMVVPSFASDGVLSEQESDRRMRGATYTGMLQDAQGENVNPNTVLIDHKLLAPTMERPDPANFALVLIQEDAHVSVLLAKDYDLRPDWKTKELRNTYSALKASFGFSLPKDHAFTTSSQAVLEGPANAALYGVFDAFEGARVLPLAYSEGADDQWGPATTIPVVLKGATADVLAFVNEKASADFAARDESDPAQLLKGRFRDFVAVPLSDLLETGSDEAAVYGESGLKKIMVAGVEMKLWSENQMRKYLLPEISKTLDGLTH